MRKLFIFHLLLILAIGNATAQTKVQRGIVRKQTFYPNDKTVPVQGVQFAVKGASDVSSVVSDANGKFSLNVKDNKIHKFSLAAVRPASYNLLSPKEGEQIGLHTENLIYVVVYTTEERNAFKQKERDELKQKNKQQMLEIKELRDQRDEALLMLKKGDARYAQVTAERDSLQRLFTYYIENSEKIDKIVDEITEKLAQADYQSLDSIDRQIYELKCMGEWKKVSDLINELMHGDAEASLEAIRQRQREAEEKVGADKMRLAADLQAKQDADNDYAKWCAHMEDNIESLKIQHLNDSVSHYYEILCKADSTNWKYLNQAGLWEQKYMTRYNLAMDYYSKALACAVQDTLKATSYNNIGLVYYNQDDYARALEYYQQALAIQKVVYGGSHSYVAICYNNIGLVYYNQGDYAHALKYFQQAMVIQKMVYGESHPDVATSYNNIGMLYSSQGDYIRALEYNQKALAIRKAVLGESHPDVATCYNNIGTLYLDKGDYTRALEYNQKALAIRKAVLGESHPDVATCYNNIGLVYYNQGDYAHALKYFQQALAIQKMVYGESHHYVATSCNNIGVSYCSQGKYVEALEYYQQSLAIRKAVLCEIHPDVAICYNNIGSLYDSQGDYARALEYYQRSLEISKASYGESHPHVAICYNNIGMAYSNQGDYTHALEYYQRSLEISKAIYGENHPDVSICYNNIGCCYAHQGEVALSFENLRKALAIRIAVLGENHPDTQSLRKIIEDVENEINKQSK